MRSGRLGAVIHLTVGPSPKRNRAGLPVSAAASIRLVLVVGEGDSSLATLLEARQSSTKNGTGLLPIQILGMLIGFAHYSRLIREQ
jgi:hypothetical protein